MKYQTAPPSSQVTQSFLYNKSYWLDVKGREVGDKNHFVKNQGDLILNMVQRSFEKCDHKPKLYIISPFTTVVSGIKAHLKQNQELRNHDGFNEWLEESVGTVHKFQGREANEVIMALGCDGRAKGAVNWVNKNILNVAATRAKYRFYIVGDFDLWVESRIFQLAGENIDYMSYEALKTSEGVS